VIVGRGGRDEMLFDGSNNGLPMGSEVILLFTVYVLYYIYYNVKTCTPTPKMSKSLLTKWKSVFVSKCKIV